MKIALNWQILGARCRGHRRSGETSAAELYNVEIKSFTTRNFKLENGQVLPWR